MSLSLTELHMFLVAAVLVPLVVAAFVGTVLGHARTPLGPALIMIIGVGVLYPVWVAVLDIWPTHLNPVSVVLVLAMMVLMAIVAAVFYTKVSSPSSG